MLKNEITYLYEEMRMVSIDLSGTTSKSKYVNDEKIDFKYKEIWKRAMFNIKIQRVLKRFKEDIMMFGTTNNLRDQNSRYKLNIENILQKKFLKQETFRLMNSFSLENLSRWYLFEPDSVRAKIWNLIILLVLFYTSAILPYRMAFLTPVFWDTWSIIEVIIDAIFILDIFVNFLTPFYNSDMTLERELKQIAKRYAKTWLLLDVLISVPYTFVDYFSDDPAEHRYNTMIRLIRMPRLYKLLKIIRLFKIMKNYKYNEVLRDFFHRNSRILKLFKFSLSIGLCIHVAGCLWFFLARLDSFSPESWVIRHGFYDSSVSLQYMASIYWAFTTITTVGFGDITPRTELEIMFSIVLMIAGVAFYSYTIGSLTSFFTNMDSNEAVLSSKLSAIRAFQKETRLTPELARKMRRVVKYHHSKGTVVWKDIFALIKELPKYLRCEIATTMHGGIVKNITFFQDKDQSFIIEVMPFLRPHEFLDSEFVFREQEHVDSMYLISRGRINFVLNDIEIGFKCYLKGSYFGEIEVLNVIEHRIDSAQVCGLSELLVIDKKDFLGVLEEFPLIKKELLKIAIERKIRHSKEKKQLQDVIAIMEAYRKIDTRKSGFLYQSSQDEFSTDKLNLSSIIKKDRIEERIDNMNQRMVELEDLMSNTSKVIRNLSMNLNLP